MNLFKKINTYFRDIKTIYNNENIGFSFFFLCLFLFFLPINQKLSTLLLVSNVLISLWYIKDFDMKVFKSYIPLVLFYLIYAIAYYRDEYSFQKDMLEQKASLIAFPMIFSVYTINKQKMFFLLKTFVYGCLAAYLFFIFRALYHSIDIANFNLNPILEEYRGKNTFNPLQTNYFLGRGFAFSMQSTLTSILFSFAIGIVYYLKEEFSKKTSIIIIVLLSIGVFQIFGILGIIGWFVVMFINVNYYKKVILVALISFITILVSINYFQNNKTIEKIKNYDDRIIIWQTATETIKESYLFGFGYQEAQKKLEDNYPKTGDFGAISQQKKLDAHNIYLQIFLESGIIGFCILFYILFINFIKTKLITPVKIFFMLITLYSLTESYFNIYAGISFFSFFYCLFLNNLISNNES